MNLNRAWKRLINRIQRGKAKEGAGTAGMDPELMKGLVRGILSTREEEIDCDQCFDELDRFVDLVLAGTNAADALPLVQAHLDHCPDCREEFEALLAALRGRLSE